MKIVRRALNILLVLFVLLNIILAFQAYRFTYFYDNPNLIRTRKASEYSTGEKIEGALFGMKFLKPVVGAKPTVPFETVKLTNELGQRLEAWFIPAENPRGTVILCHGHAQTRSNILPETEYFHQLGFNTLSFDFRAHGNSGGNICTIGYDETSDLKAAYTFVERSHEKNIILWGVSMGAATILKAVPEFNLKPTRVILECPFASLYDAVEGRLRSMHVPPHPVSELLMVWGGLERSMWSFGFQPAEYARSLSMPVLLNWGAKDPRVLRDETEEIFANLVSSQKQLVVFENSGHESYCVREGAKWKETIGGFLKAAPLTEAVEPMVSLR
ncbi:alpha/beta hydrolase [Larkinella soli]|uniref:alpha/beta hydrolase n=1 Tax=Larkinella soli TaxID=1770527 RepID=UPI000FFB73CE|nr:alpha/beta fold hydrolase [Larkinella soli]